MTARQPRFEIVRTAAGWHARFRAANGQIVWATESYERKRAALRAIDLLTTGAVGAAANPQNISEVDERYVPPPVVLVPPFFVSNPPHYEREGRKVTVTHPDFWHDREYHWRQCSGDDCRQETPPAGTEVRSRSGSARRTP